MTSPDTAPVAEGADIIEPPIPVTLFGSCFAATADQDGKGISMTGPNAVGRLAEHLIALGCDPDRELSLYRAGQFIGKTSISEAAKAFI
jgi:hypothetical protein